MVINMTDKNKYILCIPLTMNKEPDGDLLCGFIMEALLSYARKTDDELLVYEMVLEEESGHGSTEE